MNARLARLLLFLALVCLAACAGDPVSPASLGGEASSRVAGRAGMAAPAVEDRPGLGTGFGERRRSDSRAVAFERASSRPWGRAVISYNDAEGIASARGSASPGSHARLGGSDFVRASLLGDGGRRLPMGFRGGVFSSDEYRAVGRPGERYVIRLENRSDARMEFVVSVDGLDVLDGRGAALDKRGYVVEPGRSLIVPGWRTARNEVAAFRFTSVRNSYAERSTGDSRNVGVIGLAVFNERGSDPRPFLEREQDRRRRADPFPGDRGPGFAQPPPR